MKPAFSCVAGNSCVAMKVVYADAELLLSIREVTGRQLQLVYPAAVDDRWF